MKILFYFLTFTLLLLFTVGCGKNCTVSGKVTFPDGTPLDSGEVVFETSTTMAKGKIQKDGTYTMISGELKGVPKGTYRVSIGGFMPTVTPPPLGANGRPTGRPQVTAPVLPVAKKFLSASTSDLTCEVKGSTKFNITVEPPE